MVVRVHSCTEPDEHEEEEDPGRPGTEGDLKHVDHTVRYAFAEVLVEVERRRKAVVLDKHVAENVKLHRPSQPLVCAPAHWEEHSQAPETVPLALAGDLANLGDLGECVDLAGAEMPHAGPSDFEVSQNSHEEKRVDGVEEANEEDPNVREFLLR